MHRDRREGVLVPSGEADDEGQVERRLRAAASLDPAMPFMSMHGTRDEIVPFWCGKKLFESSSSTRKVLKEFKRGGHNNLADQTGYIEALDEFYTTVESL